MLLKVFVPGLMVLALAILPRAARAEGPSKDECIDANEASQALRAEGKLGAAHEKLLLCLSASCPGPLRNDCADQLQQIELAQPTLVLDLETDGGGDLRGASVTMDGAPLEGALGRRAVVLDPGPHTIVVDAIGFARTELHVALREGEKLRHERIVLRSLAPAGPAPTPPAVARTSPPTEEGSRGFGYGAAGIGVAGIAVGAAFGVHALDVKSALNRACHGTACPASEQGDIDSFRSSALASDIAFGVGIAGIVTGALLLFVIGRERPSENRAFQISPWAGLGSAGIVGRFP